MADDNENQFKPITSQEQLNAVIAERIQRAEKKAIEPFADYEALKAKAAKYDQAQDESKSAEQKHTEALAKMQERLDASEAERTRARIQAKYKLSDEDAELFLTATDSAALENQAKTLAARDADRKKQQPYVPQQQGQIQEPADDDMTELARQVFHRAD